MKLEKDFRPLTLKIESKEDLQFLQDTIRYASDYQQQVNRHWFPSLSSSPCSQTEYQEKLLHFRKMIND